MAPVCLDLSGLPRVGKTEQIVNDVVPPMFLFSVDTGRVRREECTLIQDEQVQPMDKPLISLKHTFTSTFALFKRSSGKHF